MNILLLAPGFPAEMPLFTRGLADVGARVIGVADTPEHGLPPLARQSLAHYCRVPSLGDEAGVLAVVERLARELRVDRVECLWEPGMMLAARLREALGLPGMTLAETLPFRDKEEMKRRLDEAGIRTPRHFRASSTAEVRAAAAEIGYPLIVKPIAGAGSADTYRVNAAAELDGVLARTTHVREVSVEEFIEGEEFTFDTISIDGEIAYYNIAWYRPRPLVGRTVEWISPQTVTLRDVEQPDLAGGRTMGRAVLTALGFRSGFTHMEWYRTAAGEAVFGEIAARPPGARSVDLMNFGCDIDVYTGWAEAVTHGSFSQRVERRYNSAVIFKRAQGNGQIRAIVGLERLLERFGPYVVCVELLPIGARRRNWKQTLISDGYLMVRHPDLATTLEMADQVASDLQLFAG